jgi:hypothetical protein
MAGRRRARCGHTEADGGACLFARASPATCFSAQLTLPPALFPRSFADFESEIWASYVDQKTDVQGVSTGWEALDSLYRVSF